MTQEQLIHYLKGGKFLARFNPVKKDLSNATLSLIGSEIVIFQNVLNTPISDNLELLGQFRFNSKSIYGWFPEQDITIINIIDEYIENVESSTKYMYKLTYTEEAQLLKNFGKGNWKLPLVVGRETDIESDTYILNLSKPQTTLIEKAFWNGGNLDSLKWEKILVN